MRTPATDAIAPAEEERIYFRKVLAWMALTGGGGWVLIGCILIEFGFVNLFLYLLRLFGRRR
jgi:hypothetical protein